MSILDLSPIANVIVVRVIIIHITMDLPEMFLVQVVGDALPAVHTDGAAALLDAVGTGGGRGRRGRRHDGAGLAIVHHLVVLVDVVGVHAHLARHAHHAAAVAVRAGNTAVS